MDPNVIPQVSTQAPPVLAGPIVSAASAVQPTEPQVSSRAKESSPVSASELAGFVEVVGNDSIENEPLPPEVSSWMEKVNRDNTGEKPPEIVVSDVNLKPTVDPRQSRQVFLLPLDEAALKGGLHQSVSTSIRWLAEWCKRVVKKMGESTSLR